MTLLKYVIRCLYCRLPREQSLVVLNVCGNNKGCCTIFFVTSQEYIPGFLTFFSSPFIFVFQDTTCCCSDNAPRLGSKTLTLIKNTRSKNALSTMYNPDERGFPNLHFEIVKSFAGRRELTVIW